MSTESALAVATGQPAPASPGVVAPPPPKAPDMESARIAAMARKEADFVKRQEAFKAEQSRFADIKKKADDLVARGAQYDDTYKKDPVAALKLIGVSDQDIFKFLAGSEKKEPTVDEKIAATAEQIAQAKIDAFRKEQSDKEAAIIKEQDTKALNEYKATIGQVIKAGAEKYEWCAHYGAEAEALAYETTMEIVKGSKGKDMPTVDEVLDLIEELYEERDKAAMGIKKRQARETAPVVEPKAAGERTRTVTTPKGAEVPPPAIQRTRPLTNAARATTAGASRPANETPQQKRTRIEEAVRRGYL